MKKKNIMMLGLALSLSASLMLPASAMEYSISAPGDPEYGSPTSFEPVYTADGGALKNEDVSKNAALIPPGFGTPSADTKNTGTWLTPNLAPGGAPVISGGAVINGATAEVITPGSEIKAPAAAAPSTSNSAVTGSTFTEGVNDLYYQGGYVATLKIPSIGLDVKVYEGTGDNALSKGVGHFSETSIWSGNIALAGHNRGVNSYFGQIHTLDIGSQITLTTKLGTRAYKVVSVEKVNVNDTSGLAASASDMLTLYTCVRNQSDSRWKVVAVAM